MKRETLRHEEPALTAFVAGLVWGVGLGIIAYVLITAWLS